MIEPADVSLDAHFETELARLAEQGLLREAPTRTAVAATSDLLDASSNDYLGYAAEGVSRETLLALAGEKSGSGASRLIHGSSAAHLDLEQDIAEWLGLEAAMLFSSGYAANVGLLPALAGSGDRIVSDALNHASIIDGCRLSRAKTVVVPHLDLDAVRSALEAPGAHRKWVVTETYFSMDGDSPDLVRLRGICDEQGAGLLVDEAHALGVFGPEGAGQCAAAGVQPDALVGTLGKSVGVQGAFVAGSTALRRWLWGTARSLVFSTGTSPLLSALTRHQIRRLRADEAARRRLQTLSETVLRRLRSVDVQVPKAAHGPIVPVLVGSDGPIDQNTRALQLAERLRADGIRAQAIRSPTVPPGTARLRITLHAQFTEADVARLCDAIIDACRAQ